ncbi:hypothetical protein FKM82_010629 [Ascaphus truei]
MRSGTRPRPLRDFKGDTSAGAPSRGGRLRRGVRGSGRLRVVGSQCGPVDPSIFRLSWSGLRPGEINNNHVVPGWFLHFPVLVHWPEQPCTVSSDTPYLWSAGGGRLLFCSIPMMKSQMEFSVASVGTQESASGPAQTEQKQTPKPVSQSNQTIKTPHGNQPAKAAQGSKTSSGDGPPPVRKEEESTFWKISMERSRIEGSQSEFQSLTPSQIKSLEKGEKPIPTYHRQESFQKEKDAVKPEKPNVVTKQPKTINPSMASGAMDLDRPRPSQSSVSTLDDVSLPEPAAPVPSVAAKAIREKEHKEEALSAEPQRFSQINTSSVLLKTGFDFLDNW